MKRNKKNKKMNNDTKKMISLIFIFIFIIIILSAILNYLEGKSLNNYNTTEYSSIQEILEKYECIYIDEKKSDEKGYSLDIYLKFKYNTFEKNKSKQRFYENVISDLTTFINNSFRLIDEDKEITISVTRNNVSGNIIYSYLVNGMENYFSVQESKNLLKENDENYSNFEINSNLLTQLIENNWSKEGIDFGTKESTFDNYDIYFEEGLEVRTISKKVYNIKFTLKNTNKIINGITTGEEFDKIITKLGEPIFGEKEGQYIGYKDDKIYVFFTKEYVSIFRNEEADMEQFEKLLDRYINKNINLKELMNEITYLWDDYEEYRYNSSSVYINYPLKGIRIDMSQDSPLGVKIYKNCNISEQLSGFITDGKITGVLTKDLVDLTFYNTINKINDYVYASELKLINNSSLFDSLLYYSNITEEKVQFISKNNDNVNKELNEKVSQGFFISNDIYIYSIQNKGIYSFNVLTNEKNILLTGSETFNLQSYEDGILKYDNKELKVVME